MKQNSKQLTAETWIVLALSLGASAVYSIISLASKLMAEGGLSKAKTSINSAASPQPLIDALYQIASFTLGLAPAALALYLLWAISNRRPADIGLNLKHPSKDAVRALALAASIGIPGIALYFVARILGLSSQISASDYSPSVLAIILMILAAAKAALVEEVVVVAYLFDRLERIGFSQSKVLILSSLLRGSYHLYQGFGGFIGNFVMGLAFGWAYRRFGRVMPLVIAHFLMDCFVFIGYIYLPIGF